MVKESLIGIANRYVLEYSEKDKTLDRVAVKNILNGAIECYDLYNYVDYIKFVDSEQFGGCYDSQGKIITINLNAFNENCLQEDAFKKIFTKRHEMYYITNIMIVATLMHEITHVRQYKSCIEKPKSLLARLTKDQFDFDELSGPGDDPETRCYNALLEEYEKGSNFYNIMPIERLANIEADKFVDEMLEDKRYKNYKRVVAFQELKLIQSFLMGYKNSKVKHPILKYVSLYDSIANEHGVNPRTLSDNYIKLAEENKSFYDRIRLGFGITDDEYNEVCSFKKKNKVYKRIQKMKKMG